MPRMKNDQLNGCFFSGPRTTSKRQKSLSLEINRGLQNCRGYKVTLRPHPQTVKLSGDKVRVNIQKYSSNPHFTYDDQMESQE